MSNKSKRIESIVRIVFGVLFLISGIVVELLLPGPYTLVSMVLLINGVSCIVSAILTLVKMRRAEAERQEEELHEMAKEIEKVI